MSTAARNKIIVGTTLALGFLLALPIAHAHRPSDATIGVEVDGAGADVVVEVALGDLDRLLALDRDGDGLLRGGEVRERLDEIAALVVANLSLTGDGAPCPLDTPLPAVRRPEGDALVVVRSRARCPAAPRTLAVSSSLLFDVDARHRALLRVTHAGTTRTAVLRDDARSTAVDLERRSHLAEALAFVREGVWHIWIGIDHILFLLALLLPAVLRRGPRGWEPVGSARPAVYDVLAVVTAFTIAHTLTLAASTLGLIRVDSRLVEIAIALSVLLAALNNFVAVSAPRWPVAFSLGLLHGFGFASVLGDLGLSRSHVVLPLLGFNLGVEVGQLAIVLVFLPLAYLLRGTWFYRTAVLGVGSVGIAGMAAWWAFERWAG